MKYPAQRQQTNQSIIIWIDGRVMQFKSLTTDGPVGCEADEHVRPRAVVELPGVSVAAQSCNHRTVLRYWKGGHRNDTGYSNSNVQNRLGDLFVKVCRSFVCRLLVSERCVMCG